MSSMPPQYSQLYSQVERTPELGKFPRFIPQWCWMLNDGAREIDLQIKACNIELCKTHEDVFIITDYHRPQCGEPQPELDKMIGHLKVLLRQQGQDSLTFEKLVNLPEQADEFAKNFKKWKWLFKDGVYGPTGEPAAEYVQVPAGPGLFSPREIEAMDPVASFIVRHSSSIYEWYCNKLQRRSKEEGGGETEVQNYLDSESIKRSMHVASALYTSVLLSGTLGILSELDSEKLRIIVLGVMGLLLGFSLILLIPGLRRHDMVAILAAYFAVGGIFVGARSGGIS